jgi:YVTN family beta-propeller protein
MSAVRSRWAAFGAAVAVSIGAGGVLTTSASVDFGVRTVYVPITPCRLMDTRPPTDNVGPRSTPIGAGEIYEAAARGANGQCSIPSDAVAVEMSVVALDATAASFLTVFPSDVLRPNASNLNWVANQPPTSGSVKATLSAAGMVSFFNLAGSVDLVVDIEGYYADHNFDDRYYTKAQVDTFVGAGGFGPPGATGPRGPVGPSAGPCRTMTAAQIALLRWDQATTACATDDEPRWVAFDGTNLWVTNSTSNTVSRINALTGATTDIAVGLYPFGVVFDGSHVWVANRDSNSLSKVDPITAAVTNVPLGAGAQPYGVVFDGTSIWTNNSSFEMLKVNATTNVVTSGGGISGTGFSLAFDGTNVWVPDQVGNTVKRVNVGTGVVTSVTVGDNPYGVVFDGTNIWVTNGAVSGPTVDTVTKINPLTATVTATLAGFHQPRGAAFDGTWVWVSNYGGSTLTRITPATNAMQEVVVGSTPRAMSFDGVNLWVVLGNDDRLARITP